MYPSKERVAQLVEDMREHYMRWARDSLATFDGEGPLV